MAHLKQCVKWIGKVKRRRWKEISHLDQLGGMKRKKREKKNEEKSKTKRGKKLDREGKEKTHHGREEKKKRKMAEEGKMSEKLYLLSKIYEDRADGFRRSKRQSTSTRRELRVGIRI